MAGVDERLADLDEGQRAAGRFGLGGGPVPPLLIVAGAGSGKTLTLAHRTAELVLEGLDPGRILLLTFTRRAAVEMRGRTARILAREVAGRARTGLAWAGTFHAIANRLLRLHARAVGLDPAFTLLDRADAEDLLDLLRSDLGLSERAKRFPRKATCLAIYSRCVNAQLDLPRCLEVAFPWCQDWEDDLRRLFRCYVEAKQRQHVLDLDDLLLYWWHLMQDDRAARSVVQRFDHVLVDEYQDTNRLQAEILLALRPEGDGLTAVGDDAQAIYGFRAATVRNILDFPGAFDPPASVLPLTRNFRSTQPILDAANAVIAEAPERFAKELVSHRASARRPRLVSVEDGTAQATYVADRVLEAREGGLLLRRQAVLFRTAHHGDLLQVELARRDVPFVIYGGLRFLEAAHVKDLLAVLRWVENPRDAVSGFRVVQLLPGIGPATARKILGHFYERRFDFAALADVSAPAATGDDWPALCALLVDLASSEWPGQVHRTRCWYEPHLDRLHESAPVRAGDLEQLEEIAGTTPSRERFLSELSLDPPSATGDLARDPHLDEDYLVLSTIHSAKGQEWDHVFVLNVVDGCIPSDMAVSTPHEIEEERRLLYVAMTRARDELELIQPHRFYAHRQPRLGDRHVYAPRSRFLPPHVLERLERVRATPGDETDAVRESAPEPRDVGARIRAMW